MATYNTATTSPVGQINTTGGNIAIGTSTNTAWLNSPYNGTTYNSSINDYGEVLKDLARKKLPNSQAVKPSAPSPNVTDFKVTQINKHQTDTPDSVRLRDLSNCQKNIQSEIKQILSAIS